MAAKAKEEKKSGVAKAWHQLIERNIKIEAAAAMKRNQMKAA